MARCERKSCGREVESWELVDGLCPRCIAQFERTIARLQRKLDKLKEEARSPAIEELTDMAAALTRAKKKIRIMLAERGRELTLEEVDEVMGRMDERKIRVTPESVVEFVLNGG